MGCAQVHHSYTSGSWVGPNLQGTYGANHDVLEAIKCALGCFMPGMCHNTK